MKKEILVLGMVVTLVAALVVPTAALAAHEADQDAETSKAVTILIKAQDGTTDVTDITFPAAAASATGVMPQNNVDGAGSPQVFHASTSKPVVKLVTTTAYIAWINITDTDNWAETVSEEYYLIDNAESAAIDSATFTSDKTAFGTWDAEESTTVTLVVSSTNDNDLYLTVDLQAATGQTGTSTLTILGETL